MSIIDLQRRFHAEIVMDDEGAAPSSPGMAVYRHAYRSRLLDCLTASFEKTRRWAGEDAFTAAACHHILTHPPHGWTLDTYGAEFPATLAALFANNPEVAELAWLEWEMRRSFSAPNEAVFTLVDFQKLAAGELDWDGLRLTLCANVAWRTVRTRCDELWQALEDGRVPDTLPERVETATLLIWRQGLLPRFRLVGVAEATALGLLRDGHTFGVLCAACEMNTAGSDAIAELGQWLLHWIDDGLITQPVCSPLIRR